MFKLKLFQNKRRINLKIQLQQFNLPKYVNKKTITTTSAAILFNLN
jgi:hypothetical protein